MEVFRVAVRAILIALCLVISAFIIRLAYADYLINMPDFESKHLACNLNPFDADYRILMMNQGVMEINATHDLVRRSDIVNKMRKHAIDGIRYRPAAALSWEAAGVEAYIEKQLGIDRNPVIYIERALEMDPLNAEFKTMRGRI